MCQPIAFSNGRVVVVHSTRSVDIAAHSIYATLLDQGTNLASALAEALAAPYAGHRERFVRQPPVPAAAHLAWINRPTEEVLSTN